MRDYQVVEKVVEKVVYVDRPLEKVPRRPLRYRHTQFLFLWVGGHAYFEDDLAKSSPSHSLCNDSLQWFETSVSFLSGSSRIWRKKCRSRPLFQRRSYPCLMSLLAGVCQVVEKVVFVDKPVEKVLRHTAILCPTAQRSSAYYSDCSSAAPPLCLRSPPLATAGFALRGICLNQCGALRAML